MLLQNELKLGIFTSQSCSHGNEMCKEKYDMDLLKLLFFFYVLSAVAILVS